MVYLSSQEYWDFRDELARERRYIRSSESEAFLKLISDTCYTREKELPSDWPTWRAQVGHGWQADENIGQAPCPYPKERMKPLKGRAHEGRVNSKGIPCLYLGTQVETAISEVRPWIGSLVSVGQFRTTRKLKVIDCSIHHNMGFRFHTKPPTPSEREQGIWAALDQAFSQPTTRSDDFADYAATQVIAELFKNNGYDGVVYKSSFGENGYNVALFDIDSAELVSCSLYKVKSAQYQFSQHGHEYFVK